VPPSVLLDSLGSLLELQKGTNVAFEVKGQVFHAHKIVLAMRSPVFMAELYGSMSDSKMNTIAIEDMQPTVFKALLHFIYKTTRIRCLPWMALMEMTLKKWLSIYLWLLTGMPWKG
jgi:hypothetical protein